MTATLPEKLVSVGLWTVGVGWLAAGTLPLTVAHRWWDARALDRFTRIYTRTQVALTGASWASTVDPAVDPNGVYLFCQNHINLFDHCTMYNATPHVKTGIELESHFKIPLYGWFMKARGTIPVNREEKTDLIRLVRRVKDEIGRGNSLLAFPEGTRTRDGRVGEFHEGLFHIARQVKVPIVPVAVTGMHEVLATGENVLRPGQKVHVHVMAPIPTADVKRQDVPALTREVRNRIAEKVDAWMDRR